LSSERVQEEKGRAQEKIGLTVAIFPYQKGKSESISVGAIDFREGRRIQKNDGVQSREYHGNRLPTQLGNVTSPKMPRGGQRGWRVETARGKGPFERTGIQENKFRERIGPD